MPEQTHNLGAIHHTTRLPVESLCIGSMGLRPLAPREQASQAAFSIARCVNAKATQRFVVQPLRSDSLKVKRVWIHLGIDGQFNVRTK